MWYLVAAPYSNGGWFWFFCEAESEKELKVKLSLELVSQAGMVQEEADENVGLYRWRAVTDLELESLLRG